MNINEVCITDTLFKNYLKTFIGKNNSLNKYIDWFDDFKIYISEMTDEYMYVSLFKNNVLCFCAHYFFDYLEPITFTCND